LNGWLWAATVLAGALAPLVLVAALGDVHQGLVAIEAAGVDAALALLLLSEGTQSQSFATLGLILAVTSFIGSIGFIRFLAQLRSLGEDGA
jgi:multisubunit Na+/H+ antiporter MnhF subunit